VRERERERKREDLPPAEQGSKVDRCCI